MTEQEKRQKQKQSDMLMITLGYLGLSFFITHFMSVVSSYEVFEISMLDKALNETIASIEATPFIMPQGEGIKVLGLITMFYIIFILLKLTDNKKYMPNKEHGSAEWAHKNDIKRIADKDRKKNILFTDSEGMSLDTRKTRKNLNILTIGGSGSGKTRFFVKPNILQANTSYVITDPKGELLRDTGKFLEAQGYKVKVFNLIDLQYSYRYNPFTYIEKESDVLKVIHILIKNTTPKGSGGGDPFWEKSETALLQALFFYIRDFLVEEEHNFNTVLKLLRLAEVKEDDEDFKSELDLLFEKVEEGHEEHICLKQYAIFKQSAGKTAKSILVSVGVRLSVFNIHDIAKLTEADDLELNTLGDEKTALFVVIPDSDSTFNFLVSMMYSQLFNTLYYTADFKNKGRLRYHVRFMLDEFANIGQIPDFDKLVATMRSREISVSIIIQNMSQLKTMYKESWESIIGNCDTVLFLGGKEPSTLDYMSKALGKQTIHTKTTNRSLGRNSSTSYNNGIQGRELMTAQELGCMSDNQCVLLIRGMKPFLSNKIKLEKHPYYKHLYDSNAKNYYDYTMCKEIDKEEITDTLDFEEEITEERRKTIQEAFNIRSIESELSVLEDLVSNLDFEEI